MILTDGLRPALGVQLSKLGSQRQLRRATAHHVTVYTLADIELWQISPATLYGADVRIQEESGCHVPVADDCF